MAKQLTIVAVTGADSGLGKAICNALDDRSEGIVVIPIGGPETGSGFDLTDETDLNTVANFIKRQTVVHCVDRGADDYYPILVNCAGINYIDWFDQADFSMFDKLMGINVKAGLSLVQQLIGVKPEATGGIEDQDWFYGKGAVLNIVSNASHVPMTNSVFYNASKGAMHIATLALARELRKTHGICVFGISPNKLSGTGMSDYIEDRVPGLRGWSPEQAAAYQLAALPAGEETDPAQLAEFIAYLLSTPARHKYLTNTIIPYGA